jgi:hypothetical protein
MAGRSQICQLKRQLRKDAIVGYRCVTGLPLVTMVGRRRPRGALDYVWYAFQPIAGKVERRGMGLRYGIASVSSTNRCPHRGNVLCLVFPFSGGLPHEISTLEHLGLSLMFVIFCINQCLAKVRCQPEPCLANSGLDPGLVEPEKKGQVVSGPKQRVWWIPSLLSTLTPSPHRFRGSERMVMAHN